MEDLDQKIADAQRYVAKLQADKQNAGAPPENDEAKTARLLAKPSYALTDDEKMFLIKGVSDWSKESGRR